MESLKAAQKRKTEKAQQERIKYKERKLQKLEHSYREKRQQRLIQIGRIMRIMDNDEREWKLRRMRILEKDTSGSTINADIHAILILLALVSPLWLLGLCIRKLCLRGMGSKARGTR